MSRLQTKTMNPINRGVADRIVVRFIKKVPKSEESPEGWEWIDKSDKKFVLTAKKNEWDEVVNDSSAVFKVNGTIPDATDEPGRVVFDLSPSDTYLDPSKEYFCDIIEFDANYSSTSAKRVFKGRFQVNGGATNDLEGA